ncbi:MAG: hypothetical protein J5545_11095 [Bacteroidaceae bacterium]|nr:hypothetical protein [Bacteroidaceae bacterium]
MEIEEKKKRCARAPLPEKTKCLIRKMYASHTAPQIAELLGVEYSKVWNYIKNQKKVGMSWARKSKEQKNTNCSISGQKANAIRWGYYEDDS